MAKDGDFRQTIPSQLVDDCKTVGHQIMKKITFGRSMILSKILGQVTYAYSIGNLCILLIYRRGVKVTFCKYECLHFIIFEDIVAVI